MARAVLPIAALLAVACGERRTIFVPRPWPLDHTAIIVLTNERNELLEPRPRVFSSSDPIRFEASFETRVRVHVATFAPTVVSAEGKSIAECGVVFDADRTPLPEATSSWVSALVDLHEDEITFSREESAPGFTLHFESCSLPESCAGYSATLVSAPKNVLAKCIAVLDDEHALFGGKAVDNKMRLGSITGTVARLLPPDARLPGDCSHLVRSPRGGYYGVSGAGGGAAFFGLDEAGVLNSPRRFHNLDEISAAPDGTVMFTDRDERVYELDPTATTTTPRLDFPTGVRDLVVLARDRVFMRTETELIRYDGTEFISENMRALLENYSDLGGDDDVMVVVGELELVRERDPATGVYDPKPRPFDIGARLRGVAGMGGGRYIVVGDSGSAGVWTGTRWCPLNYVIDVQLAFVSVSPSKRVAYASGDDENAADGTTPLIRIEVPAPPTR